MRGFVKYFGISRKSTMKSIESGLQPLHRVHGALENRLVGFQVK